MTTRPVATGYAFARDDQIVDAAVVVVDNDADLPEVVLVLGPHAYILDGLSADYLGNGLEDAARIVWHGGGLL